MSPTAIENIDAVFHVLKAHGITACIVGELALNYYNVPRVVHVRGCEHRPQTNLTRKQDLEISVSQNHLSRASAALKSEHELFELANETAFNVYTEYRRGLPRFRFRNNSAACFVLFPDETRYCEGLVENIVTQSLHRRDSEYSFELLGLIPEDRITSLPFPFLGTLLSSCCQKYMFSQDVIPAMAIDGLIDGMDLDESWCSRNLTKIEPYCLNYLLSRVRGKISRIDYFSPNTVTCIILNNEERERLLRVPGREFSSFPRKTAGQSLFKGFLNITMKVYDEPFVKGVVRFFESQKQNVPHQI